MSDQQPRVEVISLRGHAGEQEPQELIVEGERLSVLGIDDRWLDSAACYYKVAASDGRVYLLRNDMQHRRWSLVRVWQLDA